MVEVELCKVLTMPRTLETSAARCSISTGLAETASPVKARNGTKNRAANISMKLGLVVTEEDCCQLRSIGKSALLLMHFRVDAISTWRRSWHLEIRKKTRKYL